MGTRSDFVGKKKGVCVEENQTSSGHNRLMVVSPDNNNNEYYSSDQMAAASVPFTADQRQELDRQTMIFKYMVAGVPVPPELILPITRTPSRVPHSQSSSSVVLGFLRNDNSDSEPWRCSKNGRKWRCARDVVPGKKYCERHEFKKARGSTSQLQQN